MDLNRKYELVIFDLDGTLYQFNLSGADNAIFKTRFYAKIEQLGVNFISERLSMPISEAQRVRKSVFNNFNGDISIGLEREYGIDRMDYFNSVWNLDPVDYVKEDGRLGELLRNIKIKKHYSLQRHKFGQKEFYNS